MTANPRDKFKEELIATAVHLETYVQKAIVRPGFGILAADESTGTIGKRFDKIKVENNYENRRAYRELLLTTPGWENHISGIIMFEETLEQKTKEGKPFLEVLKERNVIPGIKVDKGVVTLGGTDGETATTGIDGLGDRCKKYYEMGCRFAKWRAVLKIGKGMPSDVAIIENAHNLARYATICQENGLCPIVEPEVLIDGPHDIKTCAEASERVFAGVMHALLKQNVLLEGILIKPNMILPGSQCNEAVTPKQVAWYTVRTLSRTFVGAIPGIVFLSGGLSEENATVYLNAMNQLTELPRPWHLSFSFGRALQASCLEAWQGKEENVKKAQEAFLLRAKGNSEATLGKYAGGTGSTESLHVEAYVY